MAQRSLNTLKNWFVTRAKPLQAQFWDWLDSFWHKDDMIPMAKIDGLLAVINSFSPMVPLAPGVVQWAAPAGTMIRGFLIKDSGAGQDVLVKIGTTVGGTEIYDGEETFNTAVLKAGVIDVSHPVGPATTIYFTLTAANLTTISINIYKQ